MNLHDGASENSWACARFILKIWASWTDCGEMKKVAMGRSVGKHLRDIGGVVGKEL